MQFDPTGAADILKGILTLAGGTAAAGIIAGLIEIAKSVPGLGAWIEAGHEYLASLIASTVLVGYAAVATHYTLDAVGGFALFLAWLGLAKLIGASYDTVHAAKAAGLTTAIAAGVTGTAPAAPAAPAPVPAPAPDPDPNAGG